MHFWDLNHSSGWPSWHEMSLSDFSYNAVGSIFQIFIHSGSVKKNCGVSALYLVSAKFGVRFKMAKSPICPAIAVLELRRHATKV